ncbi:MAG: saccharopine dehydrogenase NADP-binding domain-containing protein [Chloracidobacterium sp.]|nr:saccharopine dehydrogenase NADP-binding domain-containing protein [Chloracidobacterium sp.]
MPDLRSKRLHRRVDHTDGCRTRAKTDPRWPQRDRGRRIGEKSIISNTASFSLDETGRVDAALQEVDMVLHCAGPFSITSAPMVKACLRNKKHYTDITGEISVSKRAAFDQKAQDADHGYARCRV